MPAPNPHDYAIVVGINRYSALNDIKELQGALNDADAFYDWLADPNGGGLETTKIQRLKSDLTDRYPSKNDVEDEFIALQNRPNIPGKRLIGRRLYLYFAGHGITPGETRDCAILMANASMRALGRAIPGTQAADRFTLSGRFEEVVLFMDCCRTMRGSFNVMLDMNDDALDPDYGKYTNWMYAFAAPWSGEAHEKEFVRPDGTRRYQGVFTYALIEGLQNGINPAGTVTSESLVKYVKNRVLELLPEDSKFPPEMNPQGEIIFGAPRPPSNVAVTVPQPGRQFAVFGGIPSQRIQVPAVQPGATRAEFFLAPGLYEFALLDPAGVPDQLVLKKIVGPQIEPNNVIQL
jgi:hypothetical protein